MTRLIVQSVEALDDMRGRGRRTGGNVAAAASTMLAAADQLVALAHATVAQRQAALENCPKDEIPYRRARLEAAIAARSAALTLMATTAAHGARMRARSTDAGERLARRLGAAQAEIQALSMPAGGSMPAVAGGGTGGGGTGDAASAEAPAPGSLSPAVPAGVHAALRAYSRMGGGQALNARARDRALTDEDRALMAEIDAGFAGAAPLGEVTTLYREVNLDFLDALCGTAATPEERVAIMKTGAVLHDKGYVSTSTSAGAAGRRDVHMEVVAPAGTPVIDMSARAPDGDPISVFAAEVEMLLPRGGYLISEPGSAAYDAVTGTYSLRVHYHRTT